METRTDMYGLLITLTLEPDLEVYTRDHGGVLRLPLGSGWSRALSVFNGMQPEGWVPPEPVTEAVG